MVNQNADRNVYLVMVSRPDSLTGYFHEKYGQGRQARRRLVGTVHIPDWPGQETPDVLRALAAQLELPPSERWRPEL